MKAGRFLSNYLKVTDVKEPLEVTISSVASEEFGREDDEKEKKLVLYFKELEQGLVLGKTLLNFCITRFGTDETDEWLGKKVTLYHDPNVFFRGQRVGGIRLK